MARKKRRWSVNLKLLSTYTGDCERRCWHFREELCYTHYCKSSTGAVDAGTQHEKGVDMHVVCIAKKQMDLYQRGNHRIHNFSLQLLLIWAKFGKC